MKGLARSNMAEHQTTLKKISTLATELPVAINDGKYDDATVMLNRLKGYLVPYKAQGILTDEECRRLDNQIDELSAMLYYWREGAKQSVQKLLNLLAELNIPLR